VFLLVPSTFTEPGKGIRKVSGSSKFVSKDKLLGLRHQLAAAAAATNSINLYRSPQRNAVLPPVRRLRCQRYQASFVLAIRHTTVANNRA
jgi:hypothetical protein